MDIAKLHELNYTSDSRISNSLRSQNNQNYIGAIDGVRNLNYNNSTQNEDFQAKQNGKLWNQFASSKLPIKSRLKPHQENNNKNQQSDQKLYEEGIILTHKPTKTSQESEEKYRFGENGENNDQQRRQPEGSNGPEEYDGNKLNSSPNTSWNRIFQCFGVFKPRKISSTINLNSATTTANNLFDQAKAKTTTQEELLKPPRQPEQLRRIMTDLDFCLQELAETSEILNKTDCSRLSPHFPARCVGNCWEKTFSTTQDGFSLHNLYRKLDGIDSPVLFVIEDIEGRVFGAVLSSPFKVSENFYGNSDTFLFKCRPEFEVFKWSGDNFHFIHGEDGFISVGSDDGRYGLWLDDNMYNGRTERCSTFNSPALVPQKDFRIKTVECWTVGII